MAISSRSPDRRLDEALQRVLAEIHAGLRHGHFEYSLTCEIVGQGKRRLILRAGKHYQFLIGANECEMGQQVSDSHHESADDSNV